MKDGSLLNPAARRSPVWIAGRARVGALLLSIPLMGLSTKVCAQQWGPLGLDGVSLNTVARDPSNPQLVLGGPGPEDGIGLWRSTDGGVNWELITDGLTDLHRVNTIAYRPMKDGASPGPGAAVELILIGLFEYSAEGAGLYRSVDQGRTWQPSTEGMPGSRHEITSIVFDPVDPDIVYASHNDPHGGVSKSSDGGLTWSDASNGLGPDGFCEQGCVLDLVIDPSAPSILFAALPGLADVYKTTTAAAGWFPTGLGFWPERLALDLRAPDTLFVTGSVFNLGGVARTRDGGITWTHLSDRPGLPPLLDTSHRAIAVDPATPETVWLVNEEVVSIGSTERVFRSVDGGLSWTQNDGGLESASKYYDLVPDGTSMLVATDDGVYRWAAPQSLCVRDDRTACLLNGRFLVEGEMSTFSQPPEVVPVEVMQFDGRAESDQAVFLESFAAGNFEVGVKMVDACGLPDGHPQRGHWLFLGGLTNAATGLRVEDTARPSEDYLWENAAGSFPQSLGLVPGFSCDAVQPASCARSATAACLIGDRFRVTGEMLDFGEPPRSFATRVMEFSGRAESDQAVFFESFASGNFEVGVKMVDACGLPLGHPQRGYWTFFGGLTNAATKIRVRDTVAGRTERWSVAAGGFPVSAGTTPAFPCDGDS